LHVIKSPYARSPLRDDTLASVQLAKRQGRSTCKPAIWIASPAIIFLGGPVCPLNAVIARH
jgi:hypothetical protein